MKNVNGLDTGGALIEQLSHDPTIETVLPEAEPTIGNSRPQIETSAGTVIDDETRMLINEFYESEEGEDSKEGEDELKDTDTKLVRTDGPASKGGGKFERLQRSDKHRQQRRIGKRDGALEAIAFLRKQEELSPDTRELLLRASELDITKAQFEKLSLKEQRDLSGLAKDFMRRANTIKENLNGGQKRKPLNEGNVQEEEQEPELETVEATAE